jgi:hypothetical protein
MSDTHSDFQIIRQFFDVEAEAQMVLVFQQFSISRDIFNECLDLVRNMWKESTQNSHFDQLHRYLWNQKALNAHCLVCAYLISKKHANPLDIRDIRDFLNTDFPYFRKLLLRYNFEKNSTSRIQIIRKMIENFDGIPDREIKGLALKLVERFPMQITNATERIGAATAIIAAYRILKGENNTMAILVARKFGIPKRSVDNRIRIMFTSDKSF